MTAFEGCGVLRRQEICFVNVASRCAKIDLQQTIQQLRRDINVNGASHEYVVNPTIQSFWWALYLMESWNANPIWPYLTNQRRGCSELYFCLICFVQTTGNTWVLREKWKFMDDFPGRLIFDTSMWESEFHGVSTFLGETMFDHVWSIDWWIDICSVSSCEQLIFLHPDMRTLCLRWEHHDYLIHRSTWRFILVKTSIKIWAMKNPLLFRTYTTQLCGDCSKTLQGFLLNNYEGDPRSSTQGHRAPLPKDDFFPHRSYLQWEPWQTNRVRRAKFLKPFHNLVVGWFFIFFQRLFTLLLRMIVPTTRKPTRTGSAFVAPPLHQPGTQFCCALVAEWLTHNVPACGCLVWRRCDILIILCSELSTSSIIAPNYKIQSYSKYDWRGVKFFILTILSGLHPWEPSQTCRWRWKQNCWVSMLCWEHWQLKQIMLLQNNC